MLKFRKRAKEDGIDMEQLPPSADRIVELQAQVEDTKQALLVNLELAQQRQEDLEKLQVQVESLAEEAQIFKRKAKKAKWQEWWEKTKVPVAVSSGTVGSAAVVLLILLL